MNLKGFKPNLIPNNPKDGSFTKESRNEVLEKNGGIGNYLISNKKDGCRLQLGLQFEILTRSLKQPKSELVQKRFEELNALCIELKIALDGEFYKHGLKFNEIFRFFSNTDVTRPEYKEKLLKERKKDPIKFREEYNNRSIDFLTTFHDDLKFWLFDGIVLDRPDLVGFSERMTEIRNRLLNHNLENLFIEIFDCTVVETTEELDYLYEQALLEDWEGLVITHKDHEYKFGRNSIKQGTLLKMKDDKREYDGIVLDVVEGTKSKEGTEKTVNELGRSKTSQKKEDREPSGKAKGFVVEYEGLGTFVVGLRGFDDEAKVELLKNKDNYIGQHFKYTGMPPVKDYPRHSYFECWRDEKMEGE